MDFILELTHRNVSDKELIDDVKSVAEQKGQITITMEEYNATGKYHPSTLIRRFGSWFTVLEKASLSPSRSKIGITDEELFENIEHMWRNLGRQPRYQEVRKPFSQYSAKTYENRFGSYSKALIAFIQTVNGSTSDSHTVPPSSVNYRSINYRTRFLIMQRDSFKCCLCGKSPATDPTVILHIDHIVPCAKGGLPTIENLQTLCSKCNLGKSDLDL